MPKFEFIELENNSVKFCDPSDQSRCIHAKRKNIDSNNPFWKVEVIDPGLKDVSIHLSDEGLEKLKPLIKETAHLYFGSV